MGENTVVQLEWTKSKRQSSNNNPRKRRGLIKYYKR